MSKPTDLIQGTLDLLIMKVIALEPMHGWAIAQRIKQISNDVLQVGQGSLYPALHKLEQQGWMDAFRFVRCLLNYTPHVAAGASLKHDTYLDYFVADSSVDCHRGHLELDAVRVKVLSLKEPPSATFPQVLEDLYTLPGEFIACLEWCRIPNDRMRRDLQVRRRHFFNKRVSIVNYVSPDTRPAEMLVDESASAGTTDLKVYVTADPGARSGTRKYYSAADVNALQAELTAAKATIDAAQRRAAVGTGPRRLTSRR